MFRESQNKMFLCAKFPYSKEEKLLSTTYVEGEQKKVYKPKTWLLIKITQFCSNQANILATNSAHEMIILTKFHKDWTKIVDFH